MELRSLQSIGGSSFFITLPKRWVDENKLNEKDRVYLDYNSAGLLIRPEFTSVDKVAIKLRNNLIPEDMIRELISVYIIGFDEIKIEGKIITKETRELVSKTMRKLAGLEISGEDKQAITLKYIYNPEEFSYLKVIEKMIDMSTDMFIDAIGSYLAKDKVLAQEILDRDTEMNKFYFHIIRNFSSLLQGKGRKESRFTSLLEIKYYEYIAVQLERIADHAVKIAALIVFQDKHAKTDMHILTQELFSVILPCLTNLKSVITTSDKEKAHETINTLISEEKEIYDLWSSIIKDNLAETIIILASIDRLRGYIINIAERVIMQHFVINS